MNSLVNTSERQAVARVVARLKAGHELNEDEKEVAAQLEAVADAALDVMWEKAIPPGVLAKHWGISPAAVSNLKNRKGVPDFFTLRSADLWRAENAPARPARKRGGKRATFTTSTNEERAAVPNGVAGVVHVPMGDDYDSLMIAQAEAVPVMAYKRLQDAYAGRDSASIPYELKNWAEASKHAGSVRSEFLAIREKSRSLVPIDEVKNIVALQIGELMRRIEKVGERCANDANPTNPGLAKQVIDQEIDAARQLADQVQDRISEEVARG